jgi:hypothetical protein
MAIRSTLGAESGFARRVKESLFDGTRGRHFLKPLLEPAMVQNPDHGEAAKENVGNEFSLGTGPGSAGLKA